MAKLRNVIIKHETIELFYSDIAALFRYQLNDPINDDEVLNYCNDLFNQYLLSGNIDLTILPLPAYITNRMLSWSHELTAILDDLFHVISLVSNYAYNTKLQQGKFLNTNGLILLQYS